MDTEDTLVNLIVGELRGLRDEIRGYRADNAVLAERQAQQAEDLAELKLVVHGPADKPEAGLQDRVKSLEITRRRFVSSVSWIGTAAAAAWAWIKSLNQQT